MKKITSWCTYPLLMLSFGCQFPSENAPPLVATNDFVQPLKMATVLVFEGMPGSTVLTTSAGLSLTQFLIDKKPNHLKRMTFHIYSSLRSDQVLTAIEKLHLSGVSSQQIFENQLRGRKNIQLRVTEQSYRFHYTSCYTKTGEYRFGCAVARNKALSVQNPTDYFDPLPLTPGKGRFEWPVSQQLSTPLPRSTVQGVK